MLERLIARVPRDIMNIVFVVVAIFGAIIWSLYIINPPGVDEQNKHPEQAALIAQQQAAKQLAKDRDAVETTVDLVGSTNDMLRETVSSTDALSDAEKEKLLTQVDAVAESIEAMKGALAGEDSASSDAPASSDAVAASASSAASDASASSASAAAA